MLDFLKTYLFLSKDRCVLCREKSPRALCDSCYKRASFYGAYDGLDYLDKTYIALNYDKFLWQEFLEFKFRNKAYKAKGLGIFLGDFIKNEDLLGKFDIIVYIPMEKKKEVKRGYNQGRLLAEEVGSYSQCEVFHGLKKVKSTKDQHKLSYREREDNLRGAFSLENKEGLRGRRVLLVDDVITSGKTMEEVGKTLRASCVESIIGLGLISRKYK